jgi:uncharacterized protein
MIGTVAGAWRYPVKSLQGEAVDHLDFDAAGAAGDRAWGILDQVAGKVLTGKRWGTLLSASACTVGDRTVVITLPTGVELEAGARSTDSALSAWLDHDVVLVGPSTDPVPYELTMDPTDDSSDVWDFATPPGSLVDLAPAHLLTDASLAAARALGPASDWDVRRFRPSLLVALAGDAGGDDNGGDGFPEDGWIGQVVRCGTVAFEPFMPTPRCAMPTREQPGLARDTTVSRTLSTHHGNNLGVYATVRDGGRVRVGEEVTLA